MKRRDLNQTKSTQMASQMAAGWSDEYLLSKEPFDLVLSFGCSEKNAKYILHNELTKRKLRQMNEGKELK